MWGLGFRECGIRQALEKLEADAGAATQLDGLGMLVNLREMRGMWVRDIEDSATGPAGKKVWDLSMMPVLLPHNLSRGGILPSCYFHLALYNNLS